ncbi:hypothetical protein GUITHDRAFT_139243 [Guillardia theta CCMP2712]|uniref:Transcription factor CBF/NF-Y/archaeal histone domain-containing protein n=1 Tax=Guillardia theta (strain CCMP2712) TaxID=905079 RepID=L1JA34_GUITC|nr:hypothetical protein GUITHDRAFT_139243 [Guillardia theta CCMP2712]EKX44950.1 hypothetical protein GUITHDRAFT_139243 [Guillardia theta CCMP2712]|eukprot:XP_005831930.1 hypothetical protein GUITHDRAFT_139243 [Guillardia theta CCMP2712]
MEQIRSARNVLVGIRLRMQAMKATAILITGHTHKSVKITNTGLPVTPQDKRRARALSISSTSSLCSSTSTSSWPSSNELQDMNFLIDEYQVCDTILSTNSATKLPLAGIKRHIKKYEGVSMVAAETPMVVAKLCEIFVKEMCSSVTNVEESEVQARHLAQCFMKDHFQRIWLRLASEANQETTENVKLVSLEVCVISASSGTNDFDPTG